MTGESAVTSQVLERGQGQLIATTQRQHLRFGAQRGMTRRGGPRAGSDAEDSPKVPEGVEGARGGDGSVPGVEGTRFPIA
jgi:hypothetical protein